MHDEQCTCGLNLDYDSSELLEGKMMAIGKEDNGPLVRAVIYFWDAGEGTPMDEMPAPEVLYQSRWYNSERKADRDALYRYWPLYEFKHGFKHPEDPRATRDDQPPAGVTVLAFPGFTAITRRAG